jgi:signal transduction histidine kinase
MQTEVATATARPSLARTGWSLVLLIAASVCALSFPDSLRAVAASCPASRCADFAGVQAVVNLVLAAVWLATAAVVLLAGPLARPTAWIGATFVAQALAVTAGPALTVAGAGRTGRALEAVALTMAMLVTATFPDGRFVPPWVRWVFAGFVVEQAFVVVVPPSSGSTLDVVGGVVYFAVLATAVGGQVYRYRRVSDATQRRQTKWLVYGLALFLVVSLAVSLPYFAPNWAPSLVAPGSPYDQFQTIVAALAVGVIPVCVTIAVVREQLFDIDVVIGRTLVYVTLTLVVALVYLAVVAGAGALLGGSGDTLLPLLAAAVVAVLFQPVRALVQRRVRRLLYGMQDEPYEALSGLGRRLAATLPEEDLEARVVSTVRETLRVPYVAIAQRRDDGYVITREDGTPTANRLTLPLLNQGEEVGLLLVDDEPGRRLTEPGRALLSDLARQAGPAVHGVRLTASLRTAVEQLQAARERLVVAGEEERRRMRRNLHDELAPTLAAARLTASTAADLVDRDPDAAVRALDRLQANLLAAVDDIRRLVDELRPVSLDERGLVGAIRERAGALRGQVEVTVEETQPVPELPAAVEVAAYRICQEALMNVLKHSSATTCRVRLAAEDGHLELEVADDGVGAVPGDTSGVGLASMRERAAELGGECVVSIRAGAGTRVAVRLPLHPAEA